MSKRNSMVAAIIAVVIVLSIAYYELRILGREKPDLSGIYYAESLNEVLRKNLPLIE